MLIEVVVKAKDVDLSEAVRSDLFGDFVTSDTYVTS